MHKHTEINMDILNADVLSDEESALEVVKENHKSTYKHIHFEEQSGIITISNHPEHRISFILSKVIGISGIDGYEENERMAEKNFVSIHGLEKSWTINIYLKHGHHIKIHFSNFKNASDVFNALNTLWLKNSLK